MADYVLGLDAKAYRNTGSYGSPTWDLIANLQDVTLSLTKDTADVTIRGGNGWKQEVGTLKTAAISFSMVWAPGDSDFTAFRDAFLNNTLIDCEFMDGDNTVTGNTGLRAEFSVTSFSRNEALAEAITVDVEIVPGKSSNAPTWVTIA
jgi:predicted secreted protein